MQDYKGETKETLKREIKMRHKQDIHPRENRKQNKAEMISIISS